MSRGNLNARRSSSAPTSSLASRLSIVDWGSDTHGYDVERLAAKIDPPGIGPRAAVTAGS
jgi:hypothetical protein